MPYVLQTHYSGSRSSRRLCAAPMAGLRSESPDELHSSRRLPHAHVSFADGECSLCIYRVYCAIGKFCTWCYISPMNSRCKCRLKDLTGSGHCIWFYVCGIPDTHEGFANPAELYPTPQTWINTYGNLRTPVSAVHPFNPRKLSVYIRVTWWCVITSPRNLLALKSTDIAPIYSIGCVCQRSNLFLFTDKLKRTLESS